ncbi:MAG: lysylphosphatidylglycerol synthase domain-containing protein, partial [Proteobacteria bacterium]|nr:lysylphosphatidylglycerol synthase domain-containing protein [Pseudomonadota bacterium]
MISDRIELGHPSMWLAAAAISIGVLGLLLWQIDIAAFADMLRNVNVPLLLLSFGFFSGEAIVTALRLRMFALGKPGMRQALETNAWYVVLVLMLPARLGEIAAVAVFVRYLGQNRGSALMSIIGQRLFDLIIISMLFVIFASQALGVSSGSGLIIVSGLVITLAYIGVAHMPMFLGWIARAAHGRHRPQDGLRRMILRIALQGRMWRRHQFTNRHNPAAFAISLLKWLFTLAGITAAMLATGLALPWQQVVIAGAVYNFIAIIPIQSIGGMGIG